MPNTPPVPLAPAVRDRMTVRQRWLNAQPYHHPTTTRPPLPPVQNPIQSIPDRYALDGRSADGSRAKYLKDLIKRVKEETRVLADRENPVAPKDTASYSRSMTAVVDSAPIPPPRPKGDKRLRTRRALVSAAAGLIAEKGFERTSLDEICARAGMTRGAFHGNFESRDALFMAVMEQETAPVSVQFQPGGSLKVQMRLLGQAVFAHARARLDRRALTAAIQLHLMTRPDLLAARAEATAGGWRSMAGGFARLVPPGSLPMPAERFVKVIDALTGGLTTSYFQAPDLIDEADFIAAFEALAGSPPSPGMAPAAWPGGHVVAASPVRRW
jgi:AcrR family transcriptional regulator